MSNITFNQKQVLLKGAIILSIAAIVTKVLSAVYRIPFQNIVGDIGFYIYQQVYPFYGIAIALSTYGFPVIISKLYADTYSTRGKEEANRLLFPLFLAIFCFCILLYFGLFFGADFLAIQMGDIHLSPLIKITSYAFLLIPVISIIRGYFQGTGNMTPTAISQVGDQTVRVALILVFALIFVGNGASLYKIGQAALFASVVGNLFGITLLIWLVFHQHSVSFKQLIGNVRASFFAIRTIFGHGIAVCISGLTLVLFQMSDAFQVYSALIKQGLPFQEAQILKGIYDRGQPLIQIGLVLATSLSLSIVPIISSINNRNRKDLHDYLRLSLYISIVVGAGAAIGLMVIMDPLNTMLFKNSSGTEVLIILSFAVLFASINATIISIMQGLGYIYYPSIIVLIGLFIKIGLNFFLLSKIGIAGAAVATNIAMMVMLFLLVMKLRKTVKFRIIDPHFFFVLFYSLVSMVLVITFFFIACNKLKSEAIDSRLFACFQSLGGAIVGGIVFLLFVIRGEVFSREELLLLPWGDKLEIFRKKNNRRFMK
ncbi:polysaccharide biosynthesis protein [Caldibacillus lycopersici]|uniref:Polysaccharide biosynthesis protein n=1 Tax=Perspicuibacillus lycopersici TaxID=1325689 RepID=A0AAE3LPU0_9BACI|nr:polysaccharide biosynthesis protein [Perspicuibacillus lycopersici]MCU9615282.1 polysaccharide biosynthesis protein [Perspicuibacillus lycopersici]